MNKNVVIGIAAFGGLLLVGGIAINQNKEKDTPNNETSSEIVGVEEESEAVGTEEEKKTISRESIPSEVPIYPGSTIARASETDSEDRHDYSLSLTTKDGLGVVLGWYADALAINNWSIKSDQNVGGYRIIQGVNKNLYTSLQATEENGTVTISQHVRINKE